MDDDGPRIMNKQMWQRLREDAGMSKHPKGYVPIEELESLIDKWSRQQETYPDTTGGKHAASAVRCCSDELLETIDEFRGDE